MQSANKKSSILKPVKPIGTPTPDETDVQSENDNVNRTNKRVSFQRKSLVKPFRLDEENKNTVWDNTYEEEVDQMDSSSSQNSGSYPATENVSDQEVPPLQVENSADSTHNESLACYEEEPSQSDDMELTCQVLSSIYIKANHLPETVSQNKCGFSSLLTFSDLDDSDKESSAASNDIFSKTFDVDAIRLEDESFKFDDSSITLGEFNTSGSGSIEKAEGLQKIEGEEASKKGDEEFITLLNYECKPFTPTPSPFNAIDYTAINNLLKTSEERMEDLRNLRLRPIDFPTNSSDLSGAGPRDPEPRKYVKVARNDFEELKKLRTPKTLLGQILDASERCKSYCDFLKHDGEKYWFKTLYGALVLVADLSSKGAVTNLKIEKNPSKRCTMTMLEHYVMKIFVESLEMNNLESALGSRFDILSLMDYTHATMLKMIELDDFLEKLQWTNSLEIDSHYRFVFKILEYREIRQIWIISVDLSDSRKKLTPECVDVEIKTFGLSSELKQRYVEDLKELVQSCSNKGHCFLKEYLEKIKGYVETLKRRKLQRNK